MKKIKYIALLSLTLGFGHIQTANAVPVICDPMQAIRVNMEVVIEPYILKNLFDSGITQLSIRSVLGTPWVEEVPVTERTMLTLENTSDPLSLSLQKGLLVTYKNCEDDIIYAFCQMNQDLEGEFPKDVRLTINPSIQKCKIETLCTQCP